MARLLSIMRRLRDPEHGCPWDLEQTFESIVPYTVEEAYEVADAIERRDLGDLKDELGDLLLQVVFHAQMASEQRAFSFDDVVDAISDKMVRRHPHVFGDASASSAGSVKRSWEEIKKRERAAKNAGEDEPGLLSRVPGTLPPTKKALKLQAVAATVGFDWPSTDDVFNKLDEELGELKTELGADQVDRERVAAELGDVFFAIINVARKLDIDPDVSLSLTNRKFVERFGEVENTLAEAGTCLDDASLEEMEQAWQAAKKHTS
ncbi:MAG: nucleoside triphosphate pyrophosphohydrolase [Pseudomonadota bacterium]